MATGWWDDLTEAQLAMYGGLIDSRVRLLGSSYGAAVEYVRFHQRDVVLAAVEPSVDLGTPPAPRWPAEEYFISFGSQYPREPHPRWPHAHHDGWVRIVVPKGAKSYEQARDITNRLFGNRWSMLYSSAEHDDYNRSFFPRGELAVATAHDDFEWSRFTFDESRAEAIARAVESASADAVRQVPS